MKAEELVAAGLVVNKNSKQPELEAGFAKELATNAPFIYAIANSDVPGFRTLYLAQRITVERDVQERQWGNNLFMGPLVRIARAYQTFRIDRIDLIEETIGAPLAVGTVMGGTRLICRQATEPFYEGHEPKLYGENSPNKGQVMTSGGEPIYEQFVLGLPEFKDDLLPLDPVVVQPVE